MNLVRPFQTKLMGIDQILHFRPNFSISAKFHNPGIPGILGIPGVRVVSQFLRCFYVHLDFSLWNSNCTDSIHFLYPFWFVIIFTLFATFWTMLKNAQLENDDFPYLIQHVESPKVPSPILWAPTALLGYSWTDMNFLGWDNWDTKWTFWAWYIAHLKMSLFKQ